MLLVHSRVVNALKYNVARMALREVGGKHPDRAVWRGGDGGLLVSGGGDGDD